MRFIAMARLVLLLLLCNSRLLGQSVSVPPLMNFQGRLTTSEGFPVADGTYAITFRLYDAPSQGVVLWEEEQSAVSVRNGVFAVLWGSLRPLSEAVFERDAYLEVQVGTGTPLLPRQRIVSGAYAFKANTVQDGAISTVKLGEFAVTMAKIALGAITPEKIADLAVLTSKLADLSVTTIKLADASVTDAKIVSVDASKITNLPVLQQQIRRGGNRIVIIGDSITQKSTADVAGGFQHLGESYANLACVLSGGKLEMIRNSGIGGNTTSEMLARFSSDVLAYSPSIVHILGGTNDLKPPYPPLATIKSNLKSMVMQTLAARALPVLGTVPPRLLDNLHRKDHLALNVWIKRLGESLNIPVIDYYAAAVDPLTGSWKAGLSADEVHPVAAGDEVMAKLLVDTLTPLLAAHTPYLSAVTTTADGAVTDSLNLLKNGCFVTDANGDGIPDFWTSYGDPSGTYALTSDAAIVGKWCRYNKAGGGLRIMLSQYISSGFAVGDTVALSGRIKTTGTTAGTLAYGVRLKFTGAGTYLSPLESWTYDLSPDDVRSGVFYLEGIVPPGTTSLEVQAVLNSASGKGSGSVSFAQLTVINLTENGQVP